MLKSDRDPVPLLASTVTAVTVFRKGAQVERTVPVPEGTTGPATISGLPLTLLDASVSVRVEGPEPRPVVVDTRVILRATDATEESDIEQRLEAARLEYDRWSTRQSCLQRLRGGLEALQPGGRPRGPEGAPVGDFQVEAQMELLAFREAETATLENELAEMERELTRARDALHLLEHERASQAPAARPGALEKAVTVKLRGQAGAGTSLLLQYQVPGARWTPAYTVAFSPSLDSAELTMRAMVAQHTGEDWTSVQLTLSTADPNEWREAPRWKSLRIGRVGESLGPSWFPPPSGVEALFADFDAARERSRRESETAGLGSRSPVKAAPPVPEPIQYAPPPPPPPMAPAPECFAEGGGGSATLAGGYVTLEQAPMNPVPAAAARAQAAFLGGAAGGLAVDALSKARRSGVIPSPGALFGRARGGQNDEDSGTGELEPVETAFTIDRKFMRYQGLRLMNATSVHRGSLVALDRLEEYAEKWTFSWSEQEVSLAMQMAAGAASRVENARPPAGYSYPGSQSGFDYAYQGQAPLDVVSDGAFHSVSLFVTDLAPKLSYVCTPRESQQVFRQASIANPSGRALPEGPADISVGGDFLHTTPLRGVTPDGALLLGLGVEQQVKVTRNTTFKESTSGLMGGTTELSHTISVEAINHLGHDIVLEVRERLPEPAPEHKDELKVILGPVKPSWESFSPQECPLLKTAYRWKLPLPSGQKVGASANYLIEISSKHELVGGNRREPQQ